MPRYLLDTNILSFLAKGLFPALAYRFRSTPQSELMLSTVTEAELLFGLTGLNSIAKRHRATTLFLNGLAIAPWDSACARHFAHVAAQQKQLGLPLSFPDTMIAAHALALDLTLVTHDHAFRNVPNLRIEDWTTGPHPA